MHLAALGLVCTVCSSRRGGSMQEEEWQEEEDIQGLPVDVCVLLHQPSDAHSSTQLQYKAVA